MPTQWLGLMLLIVFAGVLPAAGISDPFLEFSDPSWWQTVVDRLEHMILPALTLGLVLYGEYALIVRSAMLETLGEDYVMTARAKGFRTGRSCGSTRCGTRCSRSRRSSRSRSAFSSAARSSSRPCSPIPGIGLVTYEAVFDRDYPVLQGAFLILTLTVVLANFDRRPPLLPPRPADRST